MVSNESDVKGVVAKVALGEADAGVVYQTDANAVKGKVNVIQIPPAAQPVVAYKIAVVGNTGKPDASGRFVTYVLSKQGQAWLKKFGFITRSVVRHVFGAALVLCTAVALAFLVLPMLAIFLQVPPGTLVDQLTSQVVVDALLVTLKTSVIANVIILVIGTPAAYFLATRRFRGRPVVITLIELPLVLPPAVAGIGLLAAFGRVGLLGGELGAFGLSLPFTQAAVVLAVIFVASPFYLRQAVASFEAVDPNLVAAARTLGARPWRAAGGWHCPWPRAGWPRAGPWPSPGEWGSSGPRSSSPAASRA